MIGRNECGTVRRESRNVIHTDTDTVRKAELGGYSPLAVRRPETHFGRTQSKKMTAKWNKVAGTNRMS